MTKILIAGASGMMGSSLAPYLKGQGYDVVCHAHSGEGDVTQDLTDLSGSAAMLDEVCPDVIINLVAQANVDKCEENPQEAYLMNVSTVENLASWMAGKAACHLVHISTDQIYDGPGPHVESDITISNIYGFSKYASELAAAKVPCTILRTNFFGYSKTLGKESLSDWVLRKLKDKDELTVFSDVFFSPVSISTLCRMIQRVLEKRLNGTFNLGSHDGLSKADFAFAIAGAYHLGTEVMIRGSLGDLNLKAGRPRDMRMNVSRFEDAFDVILPTLAEEINMLAEEAS